VLTYYNKSIHVHDMRTRKHSKKESFILNQAVLVINKRANDDIKKQSNQIGFIRTNEISSRMSLNYRHIRFR
jgi:hypothetical protein